MNDLDKKLQAIVDDVTDYTTNPDRFSEPMKNRELTFTEQIKQAFKEAGYVKLIPGTPTINDISLNTPEGRSEEARYMTGKTWYDRFKLTFNNREGTIHHDGDYYCDGTIDEVEALAAARRAAGIEERV